MLLLLLLLLLLSIWQRLQLAGVYTSLAGLSAATATAAVGAAYATLVQCLVNGVFLKQHGANLQRAFVGIRSFLALGDVSVHSR